MKPVWKIEIGDEAPAFTLLSTGEHAGRGAARKRVSLGDYRGKNVVLAFFPAAFTPV